jgi:hypothetical protein
MEESLEITRNESGLRAAPELIRTEPELSPILQFLRYIEELPGLKISIHSDSPEGGAYMISFITASLYLFPGGKTLKLL